MYPFLQLGPITVSTYFLVISLASTIAGYWFVRRMEAREYSRVKTIDVTLVTLVSAFVGARLLHVFFEEPDFYWTNPSQILQIWNGGFVYYGGLVGGALGLYLACRFKKVPFFVAADRAAIPLSFAYAVGRIACFLNGCCYGKVCTLPWAISLNGEHRHPAPLYASAFEFLNFLVLIPMEKRLVYPGQLSGLWLILHACGRIVMEHFRGDPRGPAILGLSLGTWISVVLICLGMGLIAPRPASSQAS